jgi:hypothetical protein
LASKIQGKVSTAVFYSPEFLADKKPQFFTCLSFWQTKNRSFLLA